MILTKIGRRIALLMQVLDNPKAFGLLRRGVSSEFVELNRPWLVNAGINTVFDIGAYTGRFASVIHEILPSVMIYSFEPLADCYEELEKRMAKVSGFRAFNIALGDSNGELDFHRNEYSPSSSVLPMADLHKQNYPFTTKEHLTKVKSAKLGDVAVGLKIKDSLLIKIDVQGFEDRVIAGGRNIIKRAKVLILETSFSPLYVGQPLFGDIYDLLKEDFRYMGALSQSHSPIDGSALQEDSIFIKRAI